MVLRGEWEEFQEEGTNTCAVAYFVYNVFAVLGFSHMVVWQPRPRRWSRHIDNVAGSSDVSTKNATAHQPNDKQFELSTRPGQSRIHYFRSAREFLCVQCGYWDSSVQCTNQKVNY
jgi:hypothetical protein